MLARQSKQNVTNGLPCIYIYLDSVGEDVSICETREGGAESIRIGAECGLRRAGQVGTSYARCSPTVGVRTIAGYICRQPLCPANHDSHDIEWLNKKARV
jgi:hypothetical protein